MSVKENEQVNDDLEQEADASVQEQDTPPVKSEYDYGDPLDSAGDDEEDEAEQEEPEKAPALDDALVGYAKQLGFDDDIVSSFTSNEKLTKFLKGVERTAQAHTQWYESQRQQKQSGQQADEQKGDKPTAKKFGKAEIKLDPEKWDEDTVNVLNSINDHYGTLMEQLQAELHQRDEHLSALNGWAAQEQSQRVEREIDEWFVAQSDKYADIFGVGSVSQVGGESAAFKARQALVEEAEAMARADAQMGRPPSSWNKLLERATASRYSEKTQELARRELKGKVSKRNKQAIQRPASRSEKASTNPKAAAIDFVRQWNKKHGIGVDSYDE